ncbi:MAG TPA: BRO family protein [Ktedonobacterales bacterium]|nr:BRO family protein [Ktedonobacterales bacterium]
MSDDPNDIKQTSDANDEQAMLPFDDGSMGRLIRRQWHEGKWYFSVVDVIAALTDSDAPRRYWSDLKRKLYDDEGFSQLYEIIVQLKMRSPLDGKKYSTDAADAETMLRIVQSVPSPKAEPIKQWLAREGARRLEEIAAGLPENQKRPLLRSEMATRNRILANTATTAGVVTKRDFAIFQDFGYRGLYGGETAHDIAARKGVAKGEHILDWMESEELANNIFRAAQTEAKIRREEIDNKADANAAHYVVGKKVRETIADLGGTMPEDLPTPEQSIQQLERAEQERIQLERQPQLLSDTNQ